MHHGRKEKGRRSRPPLWRPTRKRRWRPRSLRSRRTTARVRSCASATTLPVNVEAIPTGSLSLDLALGIGGVPRGRIVEIYGPESLRQDHARAAHRRQRPEERRRGRVHRRGTRARARLRPRARRGHRQSSHLPAGHRRAGARHYRSSSCAPARWTSSSWTPSPLSSPAASLKARWARAASASWRG